MDFPDLPARLAEVQGVVGRSISRGGWDHRVRVIAVTKTHSAAAVRAAVAAGIDDAGESRVGEALTKQDELEGLAVRWHFIGGLQKRKAREVPGRFNLVHSVDRESLARELDRRTRPAGVRQEILVQVNCSEEAQKGGVAPAELPSLLDTLRDLPHLSVRGLMTMAAIDAGEAEQHRTFGLLRHLRDEAASFGHELPELSMGMSGDYAVAVEEGATMIRLGTVLFGERPHD